MSPRPKQMDLRYRRRLEVHYVAAGHAAGLGYSGNISNTGMMIRTPNVLAPGTVVNLELRLPGGPLGLRGKVVWARTGPMTWLATGRIGMGIRFLDPPADLVALLRGRTEAAAG